MIFVLQGAQPMQIMWMKFQAGIPNRRIKKNRNVPEQGQEFPKFGQMRGCVKSFTGRNFLDKNFIMHWRSVSFQELQSLLLREDERLFP